jgi:hypothetical protein
MSGEKKFEVATDRLINNRINAIQRGKKGSVSLGELKNHHRV